MLAFVLLGVVAYRARIKAWAFSRSVIASKSLGLCMMYKYVITWY